MLRAPALAAKEMEVSRESVGGYVLCCGLAHVGRVGHEGPRSDSRSRSASCFARHAGFLGDSRAAVQCMYTNALAPHGSPGGQAALTFILGEKWGCHAAVCGMKG